MNIEELNLVVEFFGDYWHRNPEKYIDEQSIKIIKDEFNV